jgi:hypothetical protein
LNWRIASAASASLPNSTNAKPRGLPVARSVGRKTSTTVPAAARSVFSSSFVVRKLRLPTKTLTEIAVPFSSGRRLRRQPRADRGGDCTCNRPRLSRPPRISGLRRPRRGRGPISDGAPAAARRR